MPALLEPRTRGTAEEGKFVMDEKIIAHSVHIMSKDQPYGEIYQFVRIGTELYKMKANYHPAVVNGEITPSNLFEIKLILLGDETNVLEP